jgi:hypothetical protein
MTPPVAGTLEPEEAGVDEPVDEKTALDEPQPIEEAASVRNDETGVVEREQPLATWVRVAIVLLALVAFFAVSLIATKQV